MRKLMFLLLALAPLTTMAAPPQQLSEHALKTFEIFKTIVEVEKSYHVLTADYDKETVKEKTCEFIRRVADIK